MQRKMTNTTHSEADHVSGGLLDISLSMASISRNSLRVFLLTDWVPFKWGLPTKGELLFFVMSLFFEVSLWFS